MMVAEDGILAVISQKDYLESISIGGLTDAAFGSPGFVKLSQAGGGAPEAFSRVVKTACRACIANCGVLATVENGRVVKLEGNPEDPMSRGRMCAKGLSGMQALYHPNRNKYPLKRVGERGGGRWRRVSWGEALGEIAEKLMDTRDKYGAEAVFCSTGGGGNPEIWSIARFCNIFGTPNWFEPGCAQCYLPRVLSYTMMYGGVDPSIADSNALELYFPEDTPIRALVLWGTAPSYSCPASGGRAVNELRARGLKTVVVDPRLTPDAAKSDLWLPIRPGTDVALLLAWTKYIIDHGLYDRDFVLRWTNLPFLVNAETKLLWRHPGGGAPDTFMVWDANAGGAKPMAYPYDEALAPELDGEHLIDGVLYKTGFRLLRESVEAYTLEEAGGICGLEPERIEKAIRIYTDNTPGAIALGVATDQTPNSVQAAMAACAIDLLRGNVEKPGVLMQRFRTSKVLKVPNYPVPVARRMLPPEQLAKRLGGTEFKGLHIWHAGHPSSILDAILTGEPYQPRVWIDRSGNKLAVVAESRRWAEAIGKLDFIVHMHMCPTSFSAYADILLPTEEWLETNMIVETCNTLVARQAAAHLWDTKDETLIWSLLAKECAKRGHEGCAKAFDAEFMGEDLPYWDSMEEFFDHITPAVGMRFREMKEKAPFEYLPKEEWRSYYVYLEEDPGTGLPRGFDTPSRKLEVYLESMITLGRTGLPFSPVPLPPAPREYQPLAYYLEPEESPAKDDAVSREFPLTLTSGRVPFYHHSTLRNIPALREMYPVPEVLLNPVDANRYGIGDGDWIWVESKRGRVRGLCCVTRGIKPGTIFMERFWNPETLNTGTHGWQEMNVNVLTKSTAPFNDVVGTYSLRAFQVKAYKAEEGPPEGVLTKPQDFKSWLPAPAGPTDGKEN